MDSCQTPRHMWMHLGWWKKSFTFSFREDLKVVLLYESGAIFIPSDFEPSFVGENLEEEEEEGLAPI